MIIFDLDGTLADCSHRRHFVYPYTPLGDFDEDFKPNWPAFYEACDQDKLIESTGRMYEHLVYSPFSANVCIWSGRCESQREKSLDWIIKNLYWSSANRDFLNNTLKMRPIGDSTPEDVLKERWLDERCRHVSLNLDTGKTTRSQHDIEFAFSGDPKTIEMFRRRGIFVFDCNQDGREF